VSLLEAVAVFLAGVGAGTINAVVGSGTLITFPTLLWIGYDPVVANVSNCVGLVPGSVSGSIGYRRELAGQRGRILRLGAASLLGGTVGAIALLELPASAFEAIVPVMIAIALVLVVVQPRLSRWLGRHRAAQGHREGPVTHAAVFATGIYGGYFGAAQGILLLAGLGLSLPDDIHRINALKNVLAGVVNAVAGLVFVIVADVEWGAVALIALGSVIGGQAGARYGRRLSPGALRGLIVVIGVLAIARLLSS
jgi:uncharacterized membrane protein YfcA